MIKDDKTLKERLQIIQSKHGKDVLIDFKTVEKKSVFSSGSFIIDKLTGINGYPIRGIIEIFGQPSTGKTTLALHAIYEFQKLNDRKVIFIDLERTLNLEYCKNIGIDLQKLILLRPKNAEETFDFIVDLLKTKEICLIVLDSVSALLPQIELESDMKSNTIGLQARLMSKALRKINYLLSVTKASIIFVNQIREKVKIFFGNPEITSGGNALRFYASLRIELRKRTKITLEKKDIGIKINVKIVKNKLSKPYQNGIISIYFGKGIDKILEIIEIALEKKVISRNGSWYLYSKIKLGHGLQATKIFLQKNKNIFDKIFKKISILP